MEYGCGGSGSAQRNLSGLVAVVKVVPERSREAHLQGARRRRVGWRMGRGYPLSRSSTGMVEIIYVYDENNFSIIQ